MTRCRAAILEQQFQKSHPLPRLPTLNASQESPTWLVTGGAGFIGSCFVRQLLAETGVRVVNLDKLTYAGHLESIPDPPEDRYKFVQGDIGDATLVSSLLQTYQPTAVVHFAAESHVDRSIDGPAAFVQTNVCGTVTLLERSLRYYHSLDETDRERFRFLHVSTDEVYGSLGSEGSFAETSPYRPNSPYAASKAASDMFVRAFHETYGLPTLLTNCSNNYGPYQLPEKLIPLMILNAAEGRPLPVYGDGQNVRDWLYVDDHCRAIVEVIRRGRAGETYNIGGDAERTNLEVVEAICDLVDQRLGLEKDEPRRRLIASVEDRPGHDRRYAIDASKIYGELAWRPKVDFETGLSRTVDWYLQDSPWLKIIRKGQYQRQRHGTGLCG